MVPRESQGRKGNRWPSVRTQCHDISSSDFDVSNCGSPLMKAGPNRSHFPTINRRTQTNSDGSDAHYSRTQATAQLVSEAEPGALPCARLWIAGLLLLCLGFAGCGGAFFIAFSSNPGGNSSVTGTVALVSVQSFQAATGTIVITAVTFSSQGPAITMNFCGDQQNLFFLNQRVTANFTSGVNCSTLVSVVAVG